MRATDTNTADHKPLFRIDLLLWSSQQPNNNTQVNIYIITLYLLLYRQGMNADASLTMPLPSNPELRLPRPPAPPPESVVCSLYSLPLLRQRLHLENSVGHLTDRQSVDYHLVVCGGSLV